MSDVSRTNSLAEQIVAFLQSHPEGASDAELKTALDVPHHAYVNQVCNRLAASG